MIKENYSRESMRRKKSSLIAGTCLFILLFVIVTWGKQNNNNNNSTDQKNLPAPLILVLCIGGGEGALYDFYRDWWRQMSLRVKTHNIVVYTVRYSVDAPGPYLDGKNRMILLPGQDSIVPGALKSTIEALEWLRKEKVYGYNSKFLLRTNLSTFWKLFMLLPWLQREEMQQDILYAGLKYHIHQEEFIPGGYLFLNYKTWNMLIDNHTELDYNTVDDVSIGRWMHSRNIPITYNLPVCIIEDVGRAKQFTDKSICQDNFVFRVKTGDEWTDAKLWFGLFNHYYV